LTSLGANRELEEWLLGYAHDPMLFALAVVIFICLLGMVMDSAANIIFVLGIVIVYYELQVVATMGGKYWEMWYFAWEDGCFVFKPNYMPKTYAMAILPISGALTSIGAPMAILEDCNRYANGAFRLAGDDEARITEV
jgi:hypothetical protein